MSEHGSPREEPDPAEARRNALDSSAIDRMAAMRQEEIWDVDAARSYDTPGAGMFAPEVLRPTVDCLVRLAGGGPALEFAIGTGRVAVPLSERGVSVTG